MVNSICNDLIRNVNVHWRQAPVLSLPMSPPGESRQNAPLFVPSPPLQCWCRDRAPSEAEHPDRREEEAYPLLPDRNITPTFMLEVFSQLIAPAPNWRVIQNYCSTFRHTPPPRPDAPVPSVSVFSLFSNYVSSHYPSIRVILDAGDADEASMMSLRQELAQETVDGRQFVLAV
ncbi:uncharacterized protein EI90DRAFT_3286357 [Cantharellus anzutake]|uniref:uncharacterized protein n=1 Tax=Cantharellus anzutake TaxID=1750568 RepID=UPI00190443FB|nr:uncharacterized protein EI90DRAFT_3286357 [Cantharellus anzutake]KAF8339981.1 hypothetical protein EI90DRAFT_3286357 [Cantharellus anzutake]